MSIRDAARAALRAGISVIPIRPDGSKAPSVSRWKKYIAEPMPIDAVDWLFGAHAGVGMICGRVSGHLECLDFDSRDAFDSWHDAMRESHDAILDRVISGFSEETPRGVHVVYRCGGAEGNLKLARIGGSTAIETRGEGGYFIAAPSNGSVHATGRAYVMMSGGVTSIADVSTEDRSIMHDVARSLDESPPVVTSRESPVTIEGGRPGDEWASQITWAQILTPHGWRLVSESGGEQYWCRPGKRHGVSATTNYHGSGYMHVFTTSTDFETRSYGKFSAWSLLNHGGDYASAARALAIDGFGSDDESSIDRMISGACEPPEIAEVEDAPTMIAKPNPVMPRELFDVPGFVGEIFRWMIASARNPQPELSLAGAILTAATLMGRKIESPTGLRTNIYAVGLARSGYGKEHVLQCMRRIFAGAGRKRMCAVEDVTSDAAIFAALQREPSSVFLLDEMGKLLSRWEKIGGGITTTIIKLHGRADGSFTEKAYARDRRGGGMEEDAPEIEAPNLSVYGTSVPHVFHESLRSGAATDGFLNRILLFEAPSKRPPHVDVSARSRSVPMSIVDVAQTWAEFDGDGHVIAMDYSDAAKKIFTAHRLACESKFDSLEDRGMHAEASLLTRLPAHAIQLALVRAAGCSGLCYAPISEDDAAWGCALADFCCASMTRMVAENVSDGDHSADVLRVVNLIRAENGCTWRRLTRAIRWKKKRILEVLETCVDGGLIRPSKRSPGRQEITVYELAE